MIIIVVTETLIDAVSARIRKSLNWKKKCARF